MNINMEQIDEMRKRTNCSYQEAKELLEKHNGDLIEAIVEFEKKHSQFKSNGTSSKKHCGFVTKLKDHVQKGFVTRFVIEKEENTILNISVNILILIIIVTMPMFWIYPVLLIAIYLMGFKIRIRKGGHEVNVNEIVDGIGSKVRAATEQMRGKPTEKQQNDDKSKVNNSEERKEDDHNQIIIK